MNQRERNDLDRHITGNYGEDQLNESDSMPPEFDELDIAEEQAIADQQYSDYLTRRGITEAEGLAEALQWCDAQD